MHSQAVSLVSELVEVPKGAWRHRYLNMSDMKGQSVLSPLVELAAKSKMSRYQKGVSSEQSLKAHEDKSK